MAKQMKSSAGSGGSAREAARSVAQPEEASIAALAYQLWLARGCPIGSDREDWFLAESMLRSQGEKEPPVAE
jgi:hypothetical protein